VGSIKSNSILFPEDDTANNRSDKWALETKEIKAWKMLSWWTLFAYGGSWASWFANETFGNDGSIVHLVFLSSLIFQRVAPLFSLFFLMEV